MPDEDMYINAAQAVAPDTTDTHALPAPPEGADSVVTDTEQHAALVEPRKMMEVQKPYGDFTISHNSELRNLSTMPGNFSPVWCSEDVGTMSDGEDGKWLTWMATLFKRQGKDTGWLTSQPEPQQNVEIDKLGEQR